MDDKGTVLLCVFGLPPRPHADDAMRAARSAVALRDGRVIFSPDSASNFGIYAVEADRLVTIEVDGPRHFVRKFLGAVALPDGVRAVFATKAHGGASPWRLGSCPRCCRWQMARSDHA